MTDLHQLQAETRLTDWRGQTYIVKDVSFEPGYINVEDYRVEGEARWRGKAAFRSDTSTLELAIGEAA